MNILRPPPPCSGSTVLYRFCGALLSSADSFAMVVQCRKAALDKNHV